MRGCRGRRLAEVDERRAAAGLAQQQEAAAADIARERMSDRQCESHRDRGVHGIAAGFQDCDADVGGVRFLGHHHRLARPHRLPAGGRHEQCENQRDHRRQPLGSHEP